MVARPFPEDRLYRYRCADNPQTRIDQFRNLTRAQEMRGEIINTRSSYFFAEHIAQRPARREQRPRTYLPPFPGSRRWPGRRWRRKNQREIERFHRRHSYCSRRNPAVRRRRGPDIVKSTERKYFGKIKDTTPRMFRAADRCPSGEPAGVKNAPQSQGNLERKRHCPRREHEAKPTAYICLLDI